MNANYTKGVRLERKLVAHLKTLGALVAQRSAGSHSLIDVFCVTWDGQPELFSCKTDGHWSGEETQKLCALQRELGELARVWKVTAVKGKLAMRRVNEPNPFKIITEAKP